MENRERNLAIYDTGKIRDYAGEKYNAISLVAACLFGGNNPQGCAEARRWLRDEIGFNGAPPVTPDHPVEPTYADNRVSIDGASKPLSDVFGEGFKDAILAERAIRANPPLIRPKSLVEIIPTETGVGKTRKAIEGLTPLTKLDFKFVYAVPSHDLADQVAADFRAKGASVEVYRGYKRPDPRAPKKHKMCRRPDVFKAVQELGIGTLGAICVNEDGTDHCPHASKCGLMCQRKATPDIWIVPSVLLFYAKPEFFPEIDAVVIDESFVGNVYGTPFKIDVQVLRDVVIEKELYNPEEQYKLSLFRHRLRDAVKENGNGPFSRAALIEHEIDGGKAEWLGDLERRPLNFVDLSPGMKDRDVEDTVKSVGPKVIQARNACVMWSTIAGFLYEHSFEEFYGDRSLSGRLTVEGSTLLVKPFRTVHHSWRQAPVAYLDATPPPKRLVEIALGEIATQLRPSAVSRQPEIAAKWSTHVRVRQILGAPATMSSVDVGAYARKKRETQAQKKKSQPGNVAEIIGYIQLQAALAYPARIGVITFKELRERIEGRLSGNIEWMHYGAVAGRNSMNEVTGLIVLGRPAAPRKVVEDAASIFAGRPIGGNGDWFEYETGGIRLADGTGHRTIMERHHDPIVEALRWQITEGALIQAIGRLRPHRRDAPCWLDIVTDVPLPIVVGEQAQWDDVKPGAIASMALQGVVLTNVSDASLVFGLSDWAARGVGANVHLPEGRIGPEAGQRLLSPRHHRPTVGAAGVARNQAQPASCP